MESAAHTPRENWVNYVFNWWQMDMDLLNIIRARIGPQMYLGLFDENMMWN